MDEGQEMRLKGVALKKLDSDDLVDGGTLEVLLVVKTQDPDKASMALSTQEYIGIKRSRMIVQACICRSQLARPRARPRRKGSCSFCSNFRASQSL